MSRMYGDPIEVKHEDYRPLRFIWRDRRYIVLVVQEHWVVSRDWWQQDDPAAGAPPEQEFWRVEATPRSDIVAAVYELRCDVPTGHWLLLRVWD